MAKVVIDNESGNILGPPVNRAGSGSDVDPTDAASFGMPPQWFQTLAAGAGAGFVLGPVGAILGAVTAHVVGQRRRQNFMRAYEYDQNVGDEMYNSVIDQIRIAGGRAETPQDRAELALLERQAQSLSNIMKSPNPLHRQEAFAELLTMGDDIGADLDEIEQASIARQEQARKERETYFNNSNTIRTDNQRESQKFIERQNAYSAMQELVNQETGYSDLSLIYAYSNIQDPGAIVTDGDVTNLSGFKTLGEALQTKIGQVLDGEGRLTPRERSEMIEGAKAFMRSEMKQQIGRNNNAVARGRAARLPNEFLNTVTVPISESLRESVVPSELPPLPNINNQEGTWLNQDTAGEGIARQLKSGAREASDAAARATAGERLMLNADTGERVVVNRNGDIVRQLDRVGEWKNARGETMRAYEVNGNIVYQNVTRENQMRNPEPPGVSVQGIDVTRRVRDVYDRIVN